MRNQTSRIPTRNILSEVDEVSVSTNINCKPSFQSWKRLPEFYQLAPYLIMLIVCGAVVLQPEKFDPDRFLPELISERPVFSYMPFGLGPKQCLGIRLAQLELKMVLVKILQKVKFEKRMDSTEKLEFRAATILQPHGPVAIKVVARSRDKDSNN